MVRQPHPATAKVIVRNTDGFRCHEREMHSTETPVVCSQCGKSFKNIRGLRYHLAAHRASNQQHQHKCPMCPMTFQIRHRLRYHLEAAHVDGRPYKCPHCPAAFKHRSQIWSHNKHVHKPKRQFRCAQCRVGKKLRNSLLSHLRLHSGARPFPCNICGNSFKTKAYLRRHIRYHGNERVLFQCYKCDKAFKFQLGLSNHQLRCHGSATKQMPHDRCFDTVTW